MSCPISVLICTFHRPGLLYGLLEALQRQTDAPPFEVVIVDNDPQGSAQTVAQAPVWKHLNIRYEIEPRSGISCARNRAVALARGDWLAMIDDDERPAHDWLSQLTRAQSRLDADGIFGPILPYYSESPPQWLLNGRFLERPRHATGAELPNSELRTGNVLLRKSLLNDGRRFDPGLGRSGGEDIHLFRQLRLCGAKLLWCDEAIVSEYQSPARLRLDWTLKWNFKGGHNFAHQELAPALRRIPSWQATGRLCARSFLFMILSSLLILLSLPLALFSTRRHVPVFFLGKAAAQWGKIMRLCGFDLESYGRIPAHAGDKSPTTKGTWKESLVTAETSQRIHTSASPRIDIAVRRRYPRWPNMMSVRREKEWTHESTLAEPA